MGNFFSWVSGAASSAVETLGSWASDAAIATLATIGEFFIYLASKVLWVAAHLLNYSIELSISDTTYANLMALNNGWVMCRDFANLFFVFVLLYIAIATILQIAGYSAKQLLVKVIVIALLVNFSLVITKVIIDASNILAVEFYTRIQGLPGVANPNMGISGVVARSVGIQGIFDLNGVQEWGGLTDAETTPTSIIMASIFGTIFILVLAFVFMAAAFMFMMRMVVLIFLMLLSPLAFLAMVLPKTGQYAGMWWDKLIKEAFFAPIVLFLLYVVLDIMIGGQIGTAILTSTGTDPTTAMSAAFTGDDPNYLGIILNYIVLIGLTVGALFASKVMGAAGSTAVMSAGKATVNWAKAGALRDTVGRGSRTIAESETLQKAARYVPGGTAAMRLAESGARLGGLDKKTEGQIASDSKFLATLPTSEKARYIKRMNPRTQRSIVGKMKPEERAEMLKSNPELASVFTHYAPTRAVLSGAGSAMKAVGLEKAGEGLEKKSQETIYDRMMAKVSGKEKVATEKATTELKRKDVVKDILDPKKSLSGPDQSKFATNIQSIRPTDMREALEEGGEKAEQFFSRLAKLNEGGTIKDLNHIVSDLGNPQLAAQIKSSPGAKSMLEAYGVIVPEEGGKKAGSVKSGDSKKSGDSTKSGDSKKEPLIKVVGKYENVDKYKS